MDAFTREQYAIGQKLHLLVSFARLKHQHAQNDTERTDILANLLDDAIRCLAYNGHTSDDENVKYLTEDLQPLFDAVSASLDPYIGPGPDNVEKRVKIMRKILTPAPPVAKDAGFIFIEPIDTHLATLNAFKPDKSFDEKAAHALVDALLKLKQVLGDCIVIASQTLATDRVDRLPDPYLDPSTLPHRPRAHTTRRRLETTLSDSDSDDTLTGTPRGAHRGPKVLPDRYSVMPSHKLYGFYGEQKTHLGYSHGDKYFATDVHGLDLTCTIEGMEEHPIVITITRVIPQTCTADAFIPNPRTGLTG